MIDFGSPNHQNITKMAPKIDPKSIENRGCVADAFLERFGVAPGRQKRAPSKMNASLLGAIFGQKSKKWHPKRHPKIDAEKVSKNDAKRLPKWMPKLMSFQFVWNLRPFENHWFFIGKTSIFAIGGFQQIEKIWKKRCRNEAWKSDAKIMPKWCQNGAKMGTKIHPISEKGGKKACQKFCWNLKPKKRINMENKSILIDPRVVFWPGRGKGGRL